MSTNTYIDPVFTTELREWVQNDTFVYEGSIYDVDVSIPAWNKGLVPGWNKGIPCSEEHKRKLRGRKHTPEARKKMCEAKRLNPMDRSYMKTEEYRKACSEAAKRRWASLDK